MKNNLYWIDAGVHSTLAEYIDVYPRYENEWFGGCFAAPTRGTARSEFLKSEINDGDFEFTSPMSIKKFASEIDIPRGLAEDSAWTLYDGVEGGCPLALWLVAEHQLPTQEECDAIYEWLESQEAQDA